MVAACTCWCTLSKPKPGHCPSRTRCDEGERLQCHRSVGGVHIHKRSLIVLLLLRARSAGRGARRSSELASSGAYGRSSIAGLAGEQLRACAISLLAHSRPYPPFQILQRRLPLLLITRQLEGCSPLRTGHKAGGRARRAFVSLTGRTGHLPTKQLSYCRETPAAPLPEGGSKQCRAMHCTHVTLYSSRSSPLLPAHIHPP